MTLKDSLCYTSPEQNRTYNAKHMSKVQISQSDMSIVQHKLSYVIPKLPLVDYAVHYDSKSDTLPRILELDYNHYIISRMPNKSLSFSNASFRSPFVICLLSCPQYNNKSL